MAHLGNLASDDLQRSSTDRAVRSSSSRAALGAITGAAQLLIQMALQALLAPVVLAYAGGEALGAFTAISQAVLYLALVDLGFGITLMRYLAMARSAPAPEEEFNRVLTNGRLVYLASNLLLAAMLLIFRTQVVAIFDLGEGVGDQARQGLLLLAAWSAVRTPLAVYGAALIATQNIATNNVILTIAAAVRLTTSLGMVALGWGLTGLMAAAIIAEVVSTVLQRSQFIRLEGRRFTIWQLPGRTLFRSMFGFGGTTLLLTLSSRLTYSTDQIVIGSMFGTRPAAAYYATQLPAFLAFNIIFRLAASAEPRLVELFARQEMANLRLMYIRLHRYTLLLAVPAAIGYAVLGERLISVWLGTDQFAGYLALMCHSVFIVTITFANIDYVFLLAAGDVRALSVLVVGEGVLNLVASFLLASIIGFQGVMLATVLVTLPRLVYQNRRVRRTLGLSAWTQVLELCSSTWAPALAGAGALVVLSTTVAPTTWSSFALVTSVFTGIYLVALALTGITSGERTWLRTEARRYLRLPA